MNVAYLRCPCWADMAGSLHSASFSQWMQAAQEGCDPAWHRLVQRRQTLKELKAGGCVLTTYASHSWATVLPERESRGVLPHVHPRRLQEGQKNRKKSSILN